MSKGDNRLKILYVIDTLKQNSKNKGPNDAGRYLSANDLVQVLQDKYELNADRKSIYSYIKSMEQYGYEFDKSKKGYYLLGCSNANIDTTSFETAELKMIADALSLSHFYPAKKTKQIIDKLEKLLPESGQTLQNNAIFLEQLIKSDNVSAVYNIDGINKAINEDKQISFHYYNIKADLHSGHHRLTTELRQYNGQNKLYMQSPYALIWKNDCYYLLSYDSNTKDLCTFRVDRMCDVIVQNGQDNEIPDIKRDGHQYFQNFNIAEYSNTAFSMFGGERKSVSLRVKKDLAKVIADYFGKDVSIYTDDFDSDYFMCSVYIQQSNMFFSWLSGFGTDIQIKFPYDIRQQYLDYLKNILTGYDKLAELESSNKS